MTRVTWLTFCACAWLVVGISGCNSRSPLDRDGAAGDGDRRRCSRRDRRRDRRSGRDRRRRSAGTGDGAGTGGSSAGTGGGGAGRGGAGGGAAGTGGACTPSVTCTPAGGRYCNTIGNGCPGGGWSAAPAARPDLQQQHLRGRTELHAAHVQRGREVLRRDRRRLWSRAPLLAVPRRPELPGRPLRSPRLPPITCVSRAATDTAARSATAAADHWTAGIAAADRPAAAAWSWAYAARRARGRPMGRVASPLPPSPPPPPPPIPG